MLYLYSKDNCPACLQLENLLKMKAKNPYKVLKLDKDYTREHLDAALAERGHPPARSFPVLFNGQNLVGGLNEGKIAVVKGEL